MRQTVVEVKGKGVVRIIDWWPEIVAHMKPVPRKEIVLPDYQSSGITPIKVIPKTGRRILDREEPRVRTWKDVHPRPRRQWQRHLHQRTYLVKHFIYPSPKLIDWERIEWMIELEAKTREELLYELINYDSDL